MATIREKVFSLNRQQLSILLFLIVLVIVMIIFSTQSPYFMSSINILRLLKHMANIALASLGLTFVMVVGHSDMSFHFVSCFAAMTMSYFIGQGAHPLPAILMGLLGGGLFGLICGIAVGKLNLPDMIATIGIGSIGWGTAYLYSNGNYIYKNFLSSGIIDLSDSKLLGVSYPTIYMVVLYFLAYVLLHRTTFGRGFYATGSSKVAAKFSGIRVERYVIAAFVFSCLTASVANIVMTAAQGNGNVKGGLVLLMPAYASVFVGMSIFRKPTIIGTFLGAFLITVMQNGFTLLTAPFYVMDLIVGLTLIISIIISRYDFGHRKPEPGKLPLEPTIEAS